MSIFPPQVGESDKARIRKQIGKRTRKIQKFQTILLVRFGDYLCR